MKKEELINFWFESAENDLDTMRLLYKNKKNTWSLFIGHLVVEKLLKGLIIRNNSDVLIVPKIHNLILLSQKAKLVVPNKIKEKIQVINTFNISARYDDYKKTFEEKCTDSYTKNQINNIEGVVKWLKEQ